MFNADYALTSHSGARFFLVKVNNRTVDKSGSVLPSNTFAAQPSGAEGSLRILASVKLNTLVIVTASPVATQLLPPRVIWGSNQ